MIFLKCAYSCEFRMSVIVWITQAKLFPPLEYFKKETMICECLPFSDVSIIYLWLTEKGYIFLAVLPFER